MWTSLNPEVKQTTQNTWQSFRNRLQIANGMDTATENKTAPKKKPKKAKRYFDVDQSDNASNKTSKQSTSDSKQKSKKKHKQFGKLKHGKDSGFRNKQTKFKPNKKGPGEKDKKTHKPYLGKPSMKWQRQPDQFPGDAPVPKTKMKKYERGKSMETTKARTGFGAQVFDSRENKLKLAVRQAARSELLLQEEPGYLEADDDEITTSVTQHEIAEAVDITSAQKFFELKLNDFGPYRVNYTRNGRFLLFGGAKGHIAAIDWMTKKLMCEINVMETIQDVKWLHQETMYAVAQKQWTYIYDNQGIELHCLKDLDQTLRMEFLPYHFLLAAGSANGSLVYLDVSIGQKVSAYSTGLGRLGVMCQNPNNAVVCLGHASGTVTMWSPSSRRPLLKLLCHQAGVRAMAVDKAGLYMATTGIDRKLKIWDLRTYKMLQSYRIDVGAGHLAFSHTDKLAMGLGSVVEVYQDCCRQTVKSPYMMHRMTSQVSDLEFCPYEDVLGVGHSKGFSSLIIPGAGEANFDALEANPYQTKNQRKQAEVKMLLEKIQPEMIHLDTGAIGKVNVKTLEREINENNKILYLKPKSLEYEPKHKQRGRSKSGKFEQRKQGVKEAHKREQVKEIIALKKQMTEKESKKKETVKPTSILDRFKRKDLR